MLSLGVWRVHREVEEDRPVAEIWRLRCSVSALTPSVCLLKRCDFSVDGSILQRDPKAPLGGRSREHADFLPERR